MPVRNARLVLLGVLVVWVLAFPATAAFAQSSSPKASPSPVGSAPSAGPTVPADAQDIVMLSGAILVPRGQTVGQIVVFHGRASVLGVVIGDVVVLDGPVTILGQVSGSVVSLNGPVRLGPTASVGGDVLGSGIVRIEPGARISGEVRESVTFTLRRSLSALGMLLGPLAVAFSSLLLGLALIAIAPRGADRVSTAARSAPFASLGWGVLLAFVLPVGSVAVAATIIGIPLGLALLLGLGLVFSCGYVWSVWSLGRLVVSEPRSRWGAFFAGWALAAAVGFVPYLDLAAWSLASVFGVGAMTVAVWRARSPGGRHRAGYAAPSVSETKEGSPAPSEPSLSSDASSSVRRVKGRVDQGGLAR